MQVFASVQLTGDKTGCFTSDLHHQWCRVTPVGAPQKIPSSHALHVAWWLWSSGIGLDIGSSEREVLLEDNELRCNQLSPIDFGAMPQSVITQVCRHSRDNLWPIIPWTCCVLISWKVTHQEMVKRTSWYWLMPSISVRPSLWTPRRHLPSPRS